MSSSREKIVCICMKCSYVHDYSERHRKEYKAIKYVGRQRLRARARSACPKCGNGKYTLL